MLDGTATLDRSFSLTIFNNNLELKHEKGKQKCFESRNISALAKMKKTGGTVPFLPSNVVGSWQKLKITGEKFRAGDKTSRHTG